jgi:hypothetical protein
VQQDEYFHGQKDVMRNKPLPAARLFYLIAITALTYSCNKSDHLPSAPTRLDKIVLDSAYVHAATLSFIYNTDNQVVRTHLEDIAYPGAPDFVISYPSPTRIKYTNNNDPQQYDLYELTADKYPVTREKVVFNNAPAGYTTFLYRYKYNSHKELDSVIITNKATQALTAFYAFDYTDGNISKITAFQGSYSYAVQMEYDKNENYFRRTDPLLFIYAYPFIDFESRSFAYFFSKNNPSVFKHTDVQPPSFTFNIAATADNKVSEYSFDGDKANKITYYYTPF